MTAIYAMSSSVAPLSVTIETGESFLVGSGDTYTFSGNTATVSGGAQPVTYLWAYSATTGGAWSILNSTTNTATPVVENVIQGDPASTATLDVTVTDLLGSVATASVPASYSYGWPL